MRDTSLISDRGVRERACRRYDEGAQTSFRPSLAVHVGCRSSLVAIHGRRNWGTQHNHGCFPPRLLGASSSRVFFVAGARRASIVLAKVGPIDEYEAHPRAADEAFLSRLFAGPVAPISFLCFSSGPHVARAWPLLSVHPWHPMPIASADQSSNGRTLVKEEALCCCYSTTIHGVLLRST